MTTATRLVTADELLALPKLDTLYELVDGELRTMAPAGGRHGEIGIALATMLDAYVREHRLGRVYGADTGFRLRRDPDTVRAPDVSFVARAAARTRGRAEVLRGCTRPRRRGALAVGRRRRV